jgi:hypothetical protein
MGTTDLNRRQIAWLSIGAIGVLLLVFVVRWLMSPPQMGADEAVFNTVDALFTAVTSKDLKRLEDCESRLRSYQDEGKLPPAAAKTLDSIIKQARSGQWKPASERLYGFMYAQRRTPVPGTKH